MSKIIRLNETYNSEAWGDRHERLRKLQGEDMNVTVVDADAARRLCDVKAGRCTAVPYYIPKAA